MFLATASLALLDLSIQEIQASFAHATRKQNFITCILHWFCDSSNAAPNHVKKSTFTCKIRSQVFILQRGAQKIHNVNDLQCYKLLLQESKSNNSGQLSICFFPSTNFETSTTQHLWGLSTKVHYSNSPLQIPRHGWPSIRITAWLKPCKLLKLTAALCILCMFYCDLNAVGF